MRRVIKIYAEDEKRTVIVNVVVKISSYDENNDGHFIPKLKDDLHKVLNDRFYVENIKLK